MFFLNICKYWSGWGLTEEEQKAGQVPDFGGLISFGPKVKNPYRPWEIGPFLVLAVVGGLWGALFNHINEKICPSNVCRRTLHQKTFECTAACHS